MTPPTLPPEIEAATTALINVSSSVAARAENDGVCGARHDDEADDRAVADAQGILRTAITSALAAAREAGRRDVLDGAAGVEEAIGSIACRRCGHDDPMTISEEDRLRSAIAADKERAVEGMRPVLSAKDAERLVNANDDETLAATGDMTARADLIAALTGAGGGR